MYTIKNFKSFKGHEGEPCGQGTLHGPTGKVAEWSDDSWGGPMQVHFVSPAAEAAFVEFAKTFMADKKDFDDTPYDVTTKSSWDLIESALFHMSIEHQEKAELMRHAKKGIAYYKVDPKSPDGKALFVSKAAYTPEAVAKLRADIPGVLEIVNETLGLPFVDAQQHAKAQENKRYKSLCRTSIVFTLRLADGTIKPMQSKQPYSSAAASALRAKYPNLVEIVNERYL